MRDIYVIVCHFKSAVQKKAQGYLKTIFFQFLGYKYNLVHLKQVF